MSRRKFLVLALFTFVIPAALAWGLSGRTSVEVVVNNQGPSTLHSVQVHVTGASYDLGDLPAGQKTAVRVRPTGESHVEVEFVNRNRRCVVEAGCYFERNHYRDSVHVHVADGQLKALECDIDLSIL